MCIHWPPKFHYRFNALHIKTVALQNWFSMEMREPTIFYTLNNFWMTSGLVLIWVTCSVFFGCFEHKNRPFFFRSFWEGFRVQGTFINAMHAFLRKWIQIIALSWIISKLNKGICSLAWKRLSHAKLTMANGKGLNIHIGGYEQYINSFLSW